MRTNIVFTFYFLIAAVSAQGTDIKQTQKDFTKAKQGSKRMMMYNKMSGMLASIKEMNVIAGLLQDQCFKQ